jgi:hypothetical protein
MKTIAFVVLLYESGGALSDVAIRHNRASAKGIGETWTGRSDWRKQADKRTVTVSGNEGRVAHVYEREIA